MSRILTSLSLLLIGTGFSAPLFASPTAPVAGAINAPETYARPAPEAGSGRETSPPTLFGKKVAIGGYGSLDVAYTRMFGEDGALLGVQGALLLDHRLHLGVAGYGWTNPQAGPDDLFGDSRRFQTGYLGGVVRYSLLRNSPIFLTLGALIGGGAVVLAPEEEREDNEVEREDVDVFAVLQPEVAVHANLTRWMRVGLTGGYRLTAGVDKFGFDNSDVNGVVAGAQLQFGHF